MRPKTVIKRPQIPVKKVEETEAIFVRGIKPATKKKLAKLAKDRKMTIGAYLNLLIRGQ